MKPFAWLLHVAFYWWANESEAKLWIIDIICMCFHSTWLWMWPCLWLFLASGLIVSVYFTLTQSLDIYHFVSCFLSQHYYMYISRHIFYWNLGQHITAEIKSIPVHMKQKNQITLKHKPASKTLLLLLFESLLDLLWFVKLNQTEDVLIVHNSLNELALCYFTWWWYRENAFFKTQ